MAFSNSPQNLKENRDAPQASQNCTHKIVLFDDENHTYNYVVDLLSHICELSKEAAFRCALEVDLTGKSIVYYGPHSACLDKLGQITSYGPDHRLFDSMYSMEAQIEVF